MSSASSPGRQRPIGRPHGRGVGAIAGSGRATSLVNEAQRVSEAQLQRHRAATPQPPGVHLSQDELRDLMVQCAQAASAASQAELAKTIAATVSEAVKAQFSSAVNPVCTPDALNSTGIFLSFPSQISKFKFNLERKNKNKNKLDRKLNNVHHRESSFCVHQ